MNFYFPPNGKATAHKWRMRAKRRAMQSKQLSEANNAGQPRVKSGAVDFNQTHTSDVKTNLKQTNASRMAFKQSNLASATAPLKTNKDASNVNL